MLGIVSLFLLKGGVLLREHLGTHSQQKQQDQLVYFGVNLGFINMPPKTCEIIRMPLFCLIHYHAMFFFGKLESKLAKELKRVALY